MTKQKKINSVRELKNQIKDGGKEFFILLNYGIISRKFIEKKGDKFVVFNYIDDTANIFSEKDLTNKEKTNIGEAIKKGAFYLDY